MKLKKIIIWLLLVIVILIGGKYIIKKYLYPYKYEEIVNKYSYEYNLDPFLVLAVIKTESNFNIDVESSKGAKGLMQIMDSTGEWIASKLEIDDFNANMLYDPEINIEFGCWYLNNLLEEFGDLSLALAAYNGGSGNVTKWLNNPEYSSDGENLTYIPFKETKKYVDKVSTRYNVYKFLYE
ncbi:lytic transglycosylase domain-containing protein [Clostridium sp.]|uniref:lytic transglycosylase domain-containing protein n=1 Tax=Clostridium sp. TaxID=1506 RepID=UPI0026165630|nr:lytic transglycosylase domain-containing protein [Clostridium sp.]